MSAITAGACIASNPAVSKTNDMPNTNCESDSTTAVDSRTPTNRATGFKCLGMERLISVHMARSAGQNGQRGKNRRKIIG
jgi:hypothetical protein